MELCIQFQDEEKTKKVFGKIPSLFECFVATRLTADIFYLFNYERKFLKKLSDFCQVMILELGNSVKT